VLYALVETVQGEQQAKGAVQLPLHNENTSAYGYCAILKQWPFLRIRGWLIAGRVDRSDEESEGCRVVRSFVQWDRAQMRDARSRDESI
jgi:hypothetical protein